MEMNWIPFFDVILIVCLLLCLVRSWQRGFLLQLVDLFSWLVAAVLAWWMSDVMADLMPLIQVDVSDVDMLNGILIKRSSVGNLTALLIYRKGRRGNGSLSFLCRPENLLLRASVPNVSRHISSFRASTQCAVRVSEQTKISPAHC